MDPEQNSCYLDAANMCTGDKPHQFKEEMENKEFKQQLFKDLKKLKNDIINNTMTCDAKYHKWLSRSYTTRFNLGDADSREAAYNRAIELLPYGRARTPATTV